MFAHELKCILKTGGREFKRQFCKLLNIIKRKMKARILLTGSAAEFYIKPNGPCIGDLDFMCERTTIVVEFQNGFHTRHTRGKKSKSHLEMILIEGEGRVIGLKSPMRTFTANTCQHILQWFFKRVFFPALRSRNGSDK